MTVDPKQRRAARHAGALTQPTDQARRNEPITVERITDAALEVVATKGYDAMTMRSVAGMLETGPASLYAHVVNKADVDELIIGRLCSQLTIPTPDPALWRQQIIGVCTELRDQYLSYPGISGAALAMGATNLDVLQVSEGMLAILLAGGIDPQTAAWAIDALYLYVGAYTLEIALGEKRRGQSDEGWAVGRDQREELIGRFQTLPVERFPNTRRYAAELTSGTGHERFDFTLGLMLDSLEQRRVAPPAR